MKTASYQIISRKYRPQTFASIVGQEAIVLTLKNALRSKKLGAAYLFCGCRGTGKTTFARTFAKALNCAHLTEDMEPCNACPSCLDVNQGRALDVLEIDGASNRGIDDIRNLNETVGYAPALGQYKIYIIDEVHMLTKEAFNALLKTLEEPPAHVKFFFATTEPHKILPTIISRCQRFDLSRIAPTQMIAKLKTIVSELGAACDQDVFETISHLSEGSLRDAESLLDQLLCSVEPPLTSAKIHSVLGLMPKRSFLALDKAFDAETHSFAFELAQDVFASGKDLAYFLDMLIDHYRTLLHIKLGRPSSLLGMDKEHYLASALYYSEEQCLYILDYLIQWQQQLGKIPFKRVFLEMVLLHILRSKYRCSAATLVKRLMNLEQKLQTATQDANLKHHAPEPMPIAEKQVRSEDKLVQEKPAKADAVPQNICPEPMPIAERQDRSEDKLVEEKPAKADAVPQNICPEPMPIAEKQGMSENKNAEEKQALSKTDSANGITAHPSRYQTLLQFAAIELEGTIK